MKKLLLLLTMMAMSTIGRAQVAIDFEPEGTGTDLTWTVFENGDNLDAFAIIDNPDASGGNTSTKVAKFIARQTGATWAGLTGKGITPFIFDETNRIIKVMVWKSVISDVGIKLETNSGWAQPEIKVANTKTGEWEELTFDFTGRENPPSEQFTGISFFPDFKEGRSADETVYFDNFSYAAANTTGGGTGGEVTSYCNTKVTHFGNGVEGFAYLTIANTSANSMIIQITSADNDPIDDLIVPGDITGSPAISAKDESKQDTISVTLTWEAAAPPANVALSILWSKASFGGNWSLSESPVTVAFNATCDGNGGGGTGEVVEVSPIDFEVGGNGADWNWEVFGGDANPVMEIVDNPSTTGNTSAKVGKITVAAAGASWSGTSSAGIGAYLFDSSTPIIKVMVWKSVISNVGVKLEAAGGWSQGEILVANTKTNEWEELTFDFSSKAINPPVEQGGELAKITFFPDFTDNRGQENVIYFDNIVFEGFNYLGGASTGGGDPTAPTTAAPTPTHAEADVMAIFSDSYTVLDGIDYNPGWGQKTVYSTMEIEGNSTIKLAGLDYQGLALAGNTDVSGMTYLHLDFWTANSTQFEVFLISPGDPAKENGVALNVPAAHWRSVDVALTEYTVPVLTEIFQMKFFGNGDIYIDNIYFHKGEPVSVEEQELTPSNFTLEQNYPNPFNPTTNISFSTKNVAQVSLEVYNVMGQKLATLVNGVVTSGNHTVTFDATNFASGMYLYKLTVGNFTSVKSMMLIK